MEGDLIKVCFLALHLYPIAATPLPGLPPLLQDEISCLRSAFGETANIIPFCPSISQAASMNVSTSAYENYNECDPVFYLIVKLPIDSSVICQDRDCSVIIRNVYSTCGRNDVSATIG